MPTISQGNQAEGVSYSPILHGHKIAYLKGIITSKMAFSCTCQPNRKEAYPQSVTDPTKVSHVGFRKTLARHNLPEY